MKHIPSPDWKKDHWDCENWVSAAGKIQFDPHREGLRKVRDEPQLVVNVGHSLAAYMRYWVWKTWHLELQSTMLQPHITVLTGKEKVLEKHLKHCKDLSGVKLEFEYSLELQQHWKFFVLPVRSKELSAFRASVGLNPAHPFHITIGRLP